MPVFVVVLENAFHLGSVARSGSLDGAPHVVQCVKLNYQQTRLRPIQTRLSRRTFLSSLLLLILFGFSLSLCSGALGPKKVCCLILLPGGISCAFRFILGPEPAVIHKLISTGYMDTQ